MLGLVNYEASDSENEITDEEDEVPTKTNGIQKISNDIENDLVISSRIILPRPSTRKDNDINEEDDDEFLHKKAIPSVQPPKKEKVKIFIPKLSDFKDDDEDDDRKIKITNVKKKNGLLGMLPKPSNCFAPAPKPKETPKVPPNVPLKSKSDLEQPPIEVKKKVGFIPYSLMSHNPKQDEKKKKKDDSDSEDETPGSFFSFASNEEDLPKVSDAEVQALVEKEQSRMEQRKRQHEEPPQVEVYHQQYYDQGDVQQNETPIDQEAMRALLGGNKAKRSKLDDIQIIDLNADQIMPDRQEWMRKSLAGETSFIATGKIDEKGPSSLAKRKHQISFLSMRAENNVQELEAMWAANRASNKEGRNKYGF